MGTWSTAKRNGLGPFSIIDVGVLEKYWKYGFNSGNHDRAHHALPAPTLQDLLNPIPMAADLSDDTMFSNPDPYCNGATVLDEDEESDDEDVEMLAPAQGPRVVHSFDAPRLAIEQYINLEATALLARLEPNGAKFPTGPPPHRHFSKSVYKSHLFDLVLENNKGKGIFT
ncbi:hypothetical protein B0H14DRAFT_3450558 [Mycena olivaceomarginata]|nr:hypothetical protein B0H14DRAFT_3450558 [Mycena olivaceomarginata]